MKKIIILIISMSLVIIGVSIYCKKAQKKEVEKEKIYASESKEDNIRYYPSGKLGNQVPTGITVQLPEKKEIAPNTILSGSTVKACLDIEPKVKGNIIWIDSNTFEYRFDEVLEPQTKYTIQIKCVPLYEGKKEEIEKLEFNFITPDFKLLSGYAKEWDERRIIALFHFNYPLDSSEIGDFVEVFDKRNNRIGLQSVYVSREDSKVAVLKFKNLSDSYKIRFKKGLPIKDKNVGLKEDEYYELNRSYGELTITGISPVEGEENYFLRIFLHAAEEKTLLFNAEKIKSYIIIEPAIPFKIVSSEAGLDLYGDFRSDEVYDVKILAGLQSIEGYQLKNDFAHSIEIPSASPKLSFAVQGLYLGKRGGAKIPIRIRKIKELYVSIRRMPPDNISIWYSDKRGERWGFYHLSEPVASKIIKVNADDRNKLYWLDLDTIFNTKEEGIYLINVSTKGSEKRNEDYWEEDYYEYEDYSRATDTMILIISDLSIIAKNSSDRVYVWTVDATSLQPKKATKIILKSKVNAIMGSCTTDSKGYCVIPYSKERERDPYLLLAKNNKEFSFLYFEKTMLSQNNFEVSGNIIPKSKYVGYFYPERDLYRPGEAVHFAIIIREFGTYKGLSLPIIAHINDPRGNELFALNSQTDGNGLAEFNLPTESSYPTGRYSIDFRVGDESITFGYFFLEEFVPQRIQVSINTDKEEYNAEDIIGGNIQGYYLFGAPAAEQVYEIICNLEESLFHPKNFAEYSFGVYRKEKLTEDLPLQKGSLNNQGFANFNCPILNLRKYKSPVIVNITGSVFESGSGRSSKTQKKVLLHPSNFYIGLKSKTSGFQPGKVSSIEGVIINKDQSLNLKVNKLYYRIYKIRHNYARIYNAAQNRFLWQWTEQFIPYQEKDVLLVKDGKFSINFTPKDYWDNYMIEVFNEGETSKSSLIFYGWSYSKTGDKAPSPEILNIKANKEKYDYGDLSKISVLLPFEGKILWTVELDGVMNYKWAEAKGEIAEYNLTIPSGISTLYVSAFLIASSENYAIRRAYGIKRIKIRPSNYLLDFKLKAPDIVKPDTKIRIEVKAPKAFAGTIAIVDEGILQITQFKTPKPYEGIFADLKLNVETYETFGWLIRKDMLEETGGGETISIGEVPSFIKLVSYWSGIVKSDNNGHLSIEYNVPQYQGRLRIMLVGLNNERLGYAEKDIIVRSDVSVLATIPRFAHTNDIITIPISLTNNTKSVIDTSFSADIKGARVLKEIPRKVRIEAGRSYAVLIPIQVNSIEDPVSINISAKSNNEFYKEEFKIAVKPDRPYLTESRFIELENGKNDLKAYLKGWIPNRLKVQLTLTPIAALTRLKHLNYLIRYPYGCIEQTSSSLLPLLHLQEILDVVEPELAEKAALKDKIYSGIQRILSMQTISGGFGYWPGNTEAAEWSSIYATFVLLQAKEAGFIVPENAIKKALNFISFYAQPYPFRYYVLALGNALNEKNINDIEILATKPDLKSEDLLFLSAALLEVGKTYKAEKIFNEVLKKKPSEQRTLSYDFYSQLREIAIRLYLAEKMYPGSKENEKLTVTLINNLSRESWLYSTQELAWAILALSQRIRNFHYAKDFSATLNVNGKEYKWAKNKWGLSYNMNINKNVDEFYIDVKAEGGLYLYLSISGFKERGTFNAYSDKLNILRKYYNYQGKELNRFNQKDLIIIQLQINNLAGTNLDNVAISDYLPAGFEIENPRLSSENLPTWVNKDSLLSVDYVDYRDDRINIFGNLSPGFNYFYYVARATLQGQYFIPPAEAVVMYEPELKTNTSPLQAFIK